MTLKKRPEVLNGKTIKVKTGCGALYIILNRNDEGELFEVRLSMGKAGECINTMLNREGILWSVLCQMGLTKVDIIKLLQRHWVGVSCNNAEKLDDKRFTSCGDVIGRTIINELQKEEDKKEEK